MAMQYAHRKHQFLLGPTTSFEPFFYFKTKIQNQRVIFRTTHMHMIAHTIGGALF
jgi:hypothetical protein